MDRHHIPIDTWSRASSGQPPRAVRRPRRRNSRPQELASHAAPASGKRATDLHRRAVSADDEEYLDRFFRVEEWTGNPPIGVAEAGQVHRTRVG